MFVQLDQVYKTYGAGPTAYSALRNVSFGVEKGEIAAILGPSGSGKSTLLNVIGGIDRASSGRVLVAGTDITRLNDHELTEYRKEKIGFVFQFYNLIPSLTVEENIEVASQISRSPLDKGDILAAVGMSAYAKRFPKELSGGQQQRVSIARALVKNPPILLCDEPTGALDYESSKEILILMQEINRRFGTTILIITHNPSIIPMTNRIIKLRSGELTDHEVNSEPVSAERIEW